MQLPYYNGRNGRFRFFTQATFYCGVGGFTLGQMFGKSGIVLVCYLYTSANYSDVLALARIHFMNLASVDCFHLLSINYTNTHTSSGYDLEASNHTKLTI